MDDVKWDSEPDSPVFISVTGHRDIPGECVESIRVRLTGLIDLLRERYPHTRLVMMSGMSEGADIITAEIASEKGLWIAPVFPMDLVDYEKTFDDPHHIDRIDRMLDGDRTYPPHILRTDPAAEEKVRYINLSSFLIRNSHILVSVWDGRRYPRNGGTYDTMRMAYSGIDAEAMRNYISIVLGRSEGDPDGTFRHPGPMEGSLIYWIYSDRTSNADRPPDDPRVTADRHPGNGGFLVPAALRSEGGVVTDIMDAAPSEGLPPFFDDLFKVIDGMNRDIGVRLEDNRATPTSPKRNA